METCGAGNNKTSRLAIGHKVTEMTAPVRDAYFALCSTQLTSDMDGVAGFIQKNQYPAPMNALRSELIN